MGATNCPETPRQKMITMMYLVYTAMLALNVSAEVVEGFRSVGTAMTNSNINLQTKLDDTYTNFDIALSNSPEKVQEAYDKAQRVKKLSKELENYIDSLEYEFIGKISGDEAEIITDISNPKLKRKVKIKNPDGTINADSLKVALQIGGFSWMEKGLDDTHEAPKFFVTGASTGGIKYAEVLKERVIAYREEVKRILGEDSSKVNYPFDVEKRFLNKDKKEVSWEEKNFDEVVAGAGLITLIRMKAETMNTEFDAVNMLYKQVSKGDHSFDQIALISRPKSTYILQGGTFETDIYVGAYDSKQDFVLNMGGKEIHSSDSGSAHYTVVCNNIGTQKVTGKAIVKGPDGDTELEITETYTVAEPSATVMLDKMQVVYAGLENPITISAPGVETKNLKASIEGGALTPDGVGHYIIKPTPGAKNVNVFVDAEIDRKITRVATYKFKVKDIPNPDLVIGIHKTGSSNAARKDFTSGDIYVIAQKNPAFEFSVPKGSMKVLSFDLSVGTRQFVGNQGNKFTPDIQSAIKKASRGDNIVVTAKVLMPDGKPREIDWIVKLKN